VSARYRKHDGVEVRPDGDGAIALHVASGQYFELNHSARFVFAELDRHDTIDALATRVVDHFGLGMDEAEEAVRELLETLLAEGLVTHDGPEPVAPERESRRTRWWRRLRGS